MTDPSFVLRAAEAGKILKGTPGNVLTFDANGESVSGQPGGGAPVVSYPELVYQLGGQLNTGLNQDLINEAGAKRVTMLISIAEVGVGNVVGMLTWTDSRGTHTVAMCTVDASSIENSQTTVLALQWGLPTDIKLQITDAPETLYQYYVWVERMDAP